MSDTVKRPDDVEENWPVGGHMTNERLPGMAPWVLACFYDRDIKALRARDEKLYRRIGDLKDDKRILNNHLAASDKTRTEQAKTIERLREGLEEYGVHMNICLLSQWHAGRPTADGGYESQFGDTWYPRGEAPPCICGLAAALKATP